MAPPASKQPPASAWASYAAPRVGLFLLLGVCLTLIWLTASGLRKESLPPVPQTDTATTTPVAGAQAEGAGGVSASGLAAAGAETAGSGEAGGTVAARAEEKGSAAEEAPPQTGEGGSEGEPGHSEREQVFSAIFANNIWASAESRSGHGSEAGYTVNIRRFMSVAFKAFGISSLLDSPCGDCNWQPLIPGFNETQYTGIDIVKWVIEENRKKYKGRTNMKFFSVDVVSQPVPPGKYDAVLCRDMIQHLPLRAGVEAYRTLEKSGAKYLFTSFHSGAKENKEIKAGDFALLDPMRPPFNFPKPLMYALEGVDTLETNFKMIGLWELPVLGRGNEESINPINPLAHNTSLIACSPDAVKKLKAVGFEDFACHSPEYCTSR